MAGLYLVGAWLLTQVASTVLPMFGAPDWLPRSIVILLAIGFLPTLIFSWAFELTPHGLKRDEDVRPEESIAPQTARRMNRMIIAVLVLALGYFAVDKFVLAPRREAAPGELSSTASSKSIAVLPFENLSSDKENAYFAEGVQDEILTRLAKVADLKVISRTSTQRFKAVPSDLREIAKQLGVMNILEGSVQKSNDQVRINVQLINAVTDAHLWAESYDRKLTDLFTVESEVAKTIADTLQAKLTGSELSAMSSRPTQDPVAQDLLVQGRHFLALRRDNNLPRAIEFFRKAIAQDPNYAAAYAGLSEALILLPRYTGAYPSETRPQSRIAALKALELNPNLAEAHNVIAKLAYDTDLDFAASEREFKRAIELNPNYAGAHHWYSGGPLESSGRFEEAIAEGKRGVELDPLSAVNLTDLGRIYASARRYPEAKLVFEKAVALDPDFPYTHWHYGEMLQVSGDLKGAAAEYARARVDEKHPEPIALMGQLAAKMGRPNEAREALRVLLELRKERSVHDYWFALLHLALNEKEEAIRCLEQSYEAGNSGYEFGIIKFDRMLDALRGDPRFEALVRKITASKAQG
jgi:TolB-like protein/Tfp pilus assembly protein PilF